MSNYPVYRENDWSSIQEFCRWAAHEDRTDDPVQNAADDFWTRMADDLEFCKPHGPA